MLPLDSTELAYCLSLPIVAALIGWVTNYVAVKMIFRPRNPVKILGVRFQGLVPKRHSELAEKIAETVETHLISHRDVESALRASNVEQQISTFINSRVDHLIKEKAASIPLIGMFISGDISSKVQEAIGDEIKASMPKLLDKLLTTMDDSIDFKKIVHDKVLSFELDRLEKIIYEISSKELKTIELLGGVLGCLVGLIQAGVYVVFRV